MPVYTAALAAFIIVLQLVLMLTVGQLRLKGKPIGVGDDKVLEMRVRRHGNLAENSGLFIATFALLELLTGQTTVVFTVTVLFAIARLLHAVGFSSLAGSHGEDMTGGRKLFGLMRALGAFGTLISGLVAAGAIAFALT